MAPTRHFVVIGLGSFGDALARRLSENGCRVTGLDSCKERVEELKDVLYEAVIGDATDAETLQHLPIKEVDAVLISMGEDITPSLLATLHAREMEAKRIIVKGVTPEHAKLLRRLGVERVIFPEVEIAVELADRMTWPNVIDFLPIDPEYSFMEVATPDSFAGQKLMELNLKRRYNLWVVGVKDAGSGQLAMFPDGEFQLAADQMLLVVGKQSDLDQLREAE